MPGVARVVLGFVGFVVGGIVGSTIIAYVTIRGMQIVRNAEDTAPGDTHTMRALPVTISLNPAGGTTYAKVYVGTGLKPYAPK